MGAVQPGQNLQDEVKLTCQIITSTYSNSFLSRVQRVQIEIVLF